MQAQTHHKLRTFPHVNDYDGGDDALLVISVTNSVNAVQPGYIAAQPSTGYAVQPNMQQKVPLFDPTTGQGGKACDLKKTDWKRALGNEKHRTLSAEIIY